MIRKIMTVIAIGASLSVAACHTVRGAGEDLKSTANTVDNAT